MIVVGFAGSCPFFEDELEPESEEYYHGVRVSDWRAALEALGRDDVFPDGTIQRWEYYARKENRILLREGIIFDGGRLSKLYVESDSEEESVEHTLDIQDESDTGTDSDSEADSNSEGDSDSEARSD